MPEEWKTDNILQCSRYVSVLLPETKDKYIDAQQEAFLNMNYAQSQYCTNQHCFICLPVTDCATVIVMQSNFILQIIQLF